MPSHHEISPRNFRDPSEHTDHREDRHTLEPGPYRNLIASVLWKGIADLESDSRYYQMDARRWVKQRGGLFDTYADWIGHEGQEWREQLERAGKFEDQPTRTGPRRRRPRV